MKPLVNLLPEVSNHRDKETFSYLENEPDDNVMLKIRAAASSIKTKQPENENDYAKLDLKVELLLHHLRKDLQSIVLKFG